MTLQNASLEEIFPVTFVVNLPSREDRWEAFCERMRDRWPFGKIVRFPAVSGQLAPPPSWWTAGEGAWGCYRSHVQILETCLTSGVERVLIMEDDAFLVDDFETSCYSFFQHLPEHWKMIYLGGQHLQQQLRLPRKLNEWVYQPFNVNRTHCYAIQGRDTIRSLYQHLNETQGWKVGHHVDHHYGEWHKRNTGGMFVPRRWLVGQIEGLSSITCKKEERNLWWGAEELTCGEISTPMVGVLGLFRGGTSCVTGVLQRLGVALGAHLKAANANNPTGFFEDDLLGEVCRNIFKEPWLVREVGSEEAIPLLRWWASKRCREVPKDSTYLGGKHPILCMLVPELIQAWDNPKFIVVDRTLEESKRSLQNAGWGWPVEAIDYVLPRMLSQRDQALQESDASHLRVDFSDLRLNPELVVERILSFLELESSPNQRQAAIEFVRKTE